MNKVLGLAFSCVATAVVIMTAGCGTMRFAAVAKVPNVGRVETKHKYKLDKYQTQEAVWVDNPSLWGAMKTQCPDVFSEDGIPFKLAEIGCEGGKEEVGVSCLFFLCSAFTIPILSTTDRSYSFALWLGSGQRTGSKFGVFTRTDSAISFFSPLALACYGGAPEIKQNGVLFYRVSHEADQDYKHAERFRVNEQAIAYSVAVRLKELESAGKIDDILLKPQEDLSKKEENVAYVQPGKDTTTKPESVQPVSVPQQQAPVYSIISCERESGSDFAYRFVLELTGKDKSLRTFRAVQKEFRQAVKEDYVESFPGVDKDSLFVEFTEYKLNNGKIEGRAVVLTISVVSLSYDPNTRKGKLAVRVNANQYEEARKWVRKNIETLARDKNIALVTGEIPPAAKFYLGREELKDGNILEIEFKTE